MDWEFTMNWDGLNVGVKILHYAHTKASFDEPEDTDLDFEVWIDGYEEFDLFEHLDKESQEELTDKVLEYVA